MKNSVKSHQASECSLIFISACDEGPGLCAHLITFLSILLVFVTIPFSLCFAVKVVQEYERVVIFRLGRLLAGGARGPGIFFIVPCVDSYQKVDMRTLTFDVPPQEVRQFVLYFILLSTYIHSTTSALLTFSSLLFFPKILTKDSVTVYVSHFLLVNFDNN